MLETYWYWLFITNKIISIKEDITQIVDSQIPLY